MSDWKMRTQGVGWRLDHPNGAVLIIGQQSAGSQTLYAWCELWMRNGDAEPLVLSMGYHNLVGRGPKTLASDARGIVSDKSKDWSWDAIITQAVSRVVRQHRAGKPMVDLAAVEEEPFRWLLRPFLEAGGETRLIAPGGSRKSYFALAICAASATGSGDVLGIEPTQVAPALYCDWETKDHGRTHRARMGAVFRGADLDIKPGLIFHEQHDLPLAARAESIASKVDKEGIGLVVIDSNSMARGSGGRGGQEAATLDFFEALRIINAPTVIIDHKNREDMEKGRTGGYGFVHNENQVRLQWEVTKMFRGDTAGDVIRLRFKNTKANNVALQADIGYELTFDNDRDNPERPYLRGVTFKPIAVEMVRGIHPGVEDDGSTEDRVEAWMRNNGTGVVSKIAAALEVDRTTVTKALRDSRFAKRGTSGRADVWGLADEDPQDELGARRSAVTGEETPAPW